MDESWRMKMGVSSSSTMSSTALEPEDFNDVFGGPPRSVLAKKHSADLSTNDWFYNEIFKQPELQSPHFVSGRKLPEFVIPERSVQRNNKIRHGKSKSMSISRSKSISSSSIMSFDELNELNNFGRGIVIGDEDDVVLSSYATKLRPINVPSKWRTSSTSTMPKTEGNNQELNNNNDNVITSYEYGYPQRIMPSPNITQLSPSSPNSSLFQGFDETNNFNNYQKTNTYDDVIDLNSQVNNNCEAIDIDEAIAWAKEKFQGWSLSNPSQSSNVSIKEQENSFLTQVHGPR